MANANYCSSYGSDNSETVHDNHGGAISAGVFYVVWDRSTHSVHPGHVFKTVADAQSQVSKLLGQPNFGNKLSIVTVPA